MRDNAKSSKIELYLTTLFDQKKEPNIRDFIWDAKYHLLLYSLMTIVGLFFIVLSVFQFNYAYMAIGFGLFGFSAGILSSEISQIINTGKIYSALVKKLNQN